MPQRRMTGAGRARSCPTDAELLRPVSAGAQRDAYARAEACFAARSLGQAVGRGALTPPALMPGQPALYGGNAWLSRFTLAA